MTEERIAPKKQAAEWLNRIRDKSRGVRGRHRSTKYPRLNFRKNLDVNTTPPLSGVITYVGHDSQAWLGGTGERDRQPVLDDFSTKTRQRLPRQTKRQKL